MGFRRFAASALGDIFYALTEFSPKKHPTVWPSDARKKVQPFLLLPLYHTILPDLSAKVGSDNEIDCKTIKGKIPFSPEPCPLAKCF